MEFSATHPEELYEVAEQILGSVRAQKIETATILALSGPLGSGKTTFVTQLARVLGITRSIQSPTFVIEKRYPVADDPDFTTCIHIDAYRLEDARELYELNWEETCANPAHLIAIEWPEQVAEAIPETAWQLTFTDEASGTRHITCTPTHHG